MTAVGEQSYGNRNVSSVGGKRTQGQGESLKQV